MVLKPEDMYCSAQGELLFGLCHLSSLVCCMVLKPEDIYCSAQGELFDCAVSSLVCCMVFVMRLSTLTLQCVLLTLPFPKHALAFKCLQYKSSENCGKRRNCSSRAISPFPTVFSNCLENFQQFSSNSKLSSANSFGLEESKICRLRKG